MSSSAVAEHPVIASIDDNGTERITVFDDDTSVICGAFRPAGHLYWQLYLAATVASAGRHATQIPPPHVLATRREDACQWVELIAHLYTHPIPAPQPDAKPRPRS